MAALADSINADPTPPSGPPVEPEIEVPVIDPTPKEETPKIPHEKPSLQAQSKTPPKQPTPPTQPNETKTPPAETGSNGLQHDEELERLSNDTRAPKRLREAYKSQRAAIEKLNLDLAKAKADLESNKSAPDSIKSLAERVEAERKRAEEAESKLAFTDYSQSNEFVQQYKKPYEAAITKAYQGLGQIPTQEGKNLTDREIQALLMSGEVEAYRTIDSIFEPAYAKFATRLVQEVYTKNQEMANKLDDHKQRAGEIHKQQTEQRKVAEARYKSVFDQATQKIRESDPELYDLDTNDSERSKLIEDGYRFVDAAFNPPTNLTLDQVAIIRAKMRHQAAILPDVRFRLNKANARIKELEAELAKFSRSTPGRGEAPTSEPEVGHSEIGTMDRAFEDLDKIVAEE